MLAFTPRLHGLLYPNQSGSIFGTPLFAFVNGSAAVILFFVLSGFVLTIGLFRSPSIWKATLSATKRWPRLAATVILANVMSGAFVMLGFYSNVRASTFVHSIWLERYYTGKSAGIHEVVRAIYEGATTFFTGQTTYNNVLWTMYYEFYGSMVVLGCAAICAIVPKHFCVVIFLSVGLYCFVWSPYPYLSPYIGPFVVGAWLASRYASFPSARWPAWTAFAAAPPLILLFGYHENLISHRAEGWYAFLNPLISPSPTHATILFHTIGSALVLMLCLRVSAIKKLLSGTAGERLGFMSFAIYLMQVPVICSISSSTYLSILDFEPFIRIGVTFVVTIVSTFALAYPLAKFDRWWVRTLRGKSINNIRRLKELQKTTPVTD